MTMLIYMGSIRVVGPMLQWVQWTLHQCHQLQHVVSGHLDMCLMCTGTSLGQGDTNLGRVLAFLCPNSLDFAALPPHINVDKPMSNNIIKEAMFLSFGLILWQEALHQDTCGASTGLLLRCLAALVHHLPFSDGYCIQMSRASIICPATTAKQQSANDQV